jgi:hypothetical protein
MGTDVNTGKCILWRVNNGLAIKNMHPGVSVKNFTTSSIEGESSGAFFYDFHCFAWDQAVNARPGKICRGTEKESLPREYARR